ncbi:MAG: FKBP-type peptidyl-prolyl cis-trans isomerase [Bacteroidota bacterium]|nr:FKBP-type peptidyl-prolyl cis-trans isomerase [Bacteroidota bacterium]
MLKVKKIGLFVIGVALMMQACNNQNKEFETTNSGLEYKFVRKGEGTKPAKGQVMTLNMTIKDPKDSLIWNSDDAGQAVPIQYMDSIPEGAGLIEEGFTMLSKGDSAIFKVPAKNFYEKTSRSAVPPYMDSSAVLTFNIGVVDVLSEDDYSAQMMREYEEKQAASLSVDSEKIESYLKENNINAQKTESGLRYTIVKEGKGTKPKPGDAVEVHYVGQTLAGDVFDTSRESVAKENNLHDPRNPYQPLAFRYGQGEMIPGFDEGVSLIGEGGQARLYLPSALAYGERGAGGRIAPNSVLIFDIELVDIK